MNISDIAVAALKKTAERELARDIHPEDKKVYEQGLRDGYAMMAEWVLEQGAEDEQVPVQPNSELQ